MSDPNDHQQNRQRGLEDARRGESIEPGDWEARESYRAGQQAHANEVAGQRYVKGLFSVFDTSGGETQSSNQFNLFGCLGALWFLAYYGIGALIIGSVAQVLTKAVFGSGLFELLAAVVGFIGGLVFIGWAFARVEMARKAYAVLLGAGVPLLTLFHVTFGGFSSTPVLDKIIAVCAATAIFGGSSWLTYRFIEKRAGVA